MSSANVCESSHGQGGLLCAVPLEGQTALKLAPAASRQLSTSAQCLCHLPRLRQQEETVLLYFHSHPSDAPAVVANVLFLLLGLWSLYRAQRCGARWTLWLPLTCFLETAGYAARLSFLRGPSKDAFIAQQVGSA